MIYQYFPIKNVCSELKTKAIFYFHIATQNSNFLSILTSIFHCNYSRSNVYVESYYMSKTYICRDGQNSIFDRNPYYPRRNKVFEWIFLGWRVTGFVIRVGMAAGGWMRITQNEFNEKPNPSEKTRLSYIYVHV